jgi:phosphoglycolate phosphatase-like HAD superfamily hydrolase
LKNIHFNQLKNILIIEKLTTEPGHSVCLTGDFHMIRVVIFDVDGTLMDTNYLHVEAWARAFSAVQHPVPRASIHRQIGKGSDLMLDTLLPDKALHGRANELHSQFFDESKDHTYPLPGAKEILATLSSQGIAIWLATSAKSEELEHHVQALEAKDTLAGLV